MRNPDGTFAAGQPRPEIRGERHPHWTGGRSIDDRGYVRISVDGGYRYEHRMVMERILGRELDYNETVHHINGDKQDNRPENLEVLSRAEHAGHHSRAPRKPRVTKPCAACGTPITRVPSRFKPGKAACCSHACVLAYRWRNSAARRQDGAA